MFEHCRAVIGQMFVELDRATAARQHLGETVFAIDQFVIPKIVALQFDQVEGDQRPPEADAREGSGPEVFQCVISGHRVLTVQ